MLVACWSVKGGVGTTVIAAALALVLAARSPAGAVLADLDGDAPAALGLPEPESPGLSGWLAAGADVPADALRRLELPVAEGLSLLPRGAGALSTGRAGLLAGLLALSHKPTVVDCGRLAEGPGTEVVARAQRSILVVRPCFLGLRRAMRSAVRPTGVVVVREPGRALSTADIQDVLQAPVVASVELDPAVARAVDSGLLVRRVPRSLAKALCDAT